MTYEQIKNERGEYHHVWRHEYNAVLDELESAMRQRDELLAACNAIVSGGLLCKVDYQAHNELVRLVNSMETANAKGGAK